MQYENINRHQQSLTPTNLLDIIEWQQFGVEYQPLIDINSGEIIAYEALARFYLPGGISVSASEIFCALHESPLMLAQVELNLKRLQLRYRPKSVPLFINLDPHAFAVLGTPAQGNKLLEMLAEQQDLVVEIIENTDVNDARISTELAAVMREMGFAIAMDDVGAADTMISLDILSEVNYIKFDRAWLQTEKTDNAIQLLKSMIAFARNSGKKTVLEGVETAADLAVAGRLGVDYVQGFFYRELFIEERSRAVFSYV